MKTRSSLTLAQLLSAIALLASVFTISTYAQTPYSWTTPGTGGSWSVSTNWTGNTSVPVGGPDAVGDVVTIATTGTTITLFNTSESGDAIKTVGSLTFSGSNTNTLNTGTASGSLDFNNSGSNAILKQTGGGTTISANMALTSSLDVTNQNGSGNTNRFFLSGLISGSGSINILNGTGIVNLSNTSNSFSGGVTINNGGTLQIGGSGAVLGTGVLTINGGTLHTSAANTLSGISGQAWNGNFILNASNGSTNLGTSGVTLGGDRTVTVNSTTSNRGFTVGGVISDGGSGYGLTVAAGTPSAFLSLTAANTYTGATTVNSGGLVVNGSIGSGVVTVNSTGTLGGSGTISGATTANSGSFITPGATLFVLNSNVVGTLTFASTLDISGLASGTGGLIFGLGATGASDKIVLTSGALTIGSGVLDLNDFSFTTLAGYGAGTYTLLSSSTSIIGTLGSNLTGTVGGLNGELSISGNDVILTVSAVPEPSTYAAIFGLLTLSGAFIARRRRS